MDMEESHAPTGHEGDTSRLRGAAPLASHHTLAEPARMLALALEGKVWGRRQHDLDCTVMEVQDGAGPLSELPQRMQLEPESLSERQPTLGVGVRGGTSPGVGRCMADSGAAFSMVTVGFTHHFGLQVTPVSGAFSVASGDTVQLLGTTTMTLQVHDHL